MEWLLEIVQKLMEAIGENWRRNRHLHRSGFRSARKWPRTVATVEYPSVCLYEGEQFIKLVYSYQMAGNFYSGECFWECPENPEEAQKRSESLRQAQIIIRCSEKHPEKSICFEEDQKSPTI